MSKTSDIKTFVTGLDHPEGLAFDRHGHLWSGGELGQVYRASPDGKTVETISQLGGFCLGMAFSPDGDLFVCNHQLPAIVRINPASGAHSIFADRAGNKKIRVPNFPVFDRAGTLYVSDSGTWGKADGCVYKFDARGKGSLFASGLQFANGLALDAGEENLFVVQSGADNVLRIPIGREQRAGRATVYAKNLYSVPDGLAFDERGTLYVCCYANSRIYAVSASGKSRVVCEDPQAISLNRPTNLAFGGQKLDRLFAANLGAYHICSIDVGARGQPLAGGPPGQIAEQPRQTRRLPHAGRATRRRSDER